jgi:hypothetical protein
VVGILAKLRGRYRWRVARQVSLDCCVARIFEELCRRYAWRVAWPVSSESCLAGILGELRNQYPRRVACPISLEMRGGGTAPPRANRPLAAAVIPCALPSALRRGRTRGTLRRWPRSGNGTCVSASAVYGGGRASLAKSSVSRRIASLQLRRHLQHYHGNVQPHFRHSGLLQPSPRTASRSPSFPTVSVSASLAMSKTPSEPVSEPSATPFFVFDFEADAGRLQQSLAAFSQRSLRQGAAALA